ncbi:MAG: helix-turn-helix domain-containing protein [Lachnospirales bacterium]
MKFGKILKNYRDYMKLTQKQVSELCHISRNHIMNIEKDYNSVSLEIMVAIYESLNLNLISTYMGFYDFKNFKEFKLYKELRV